MCDSDKIQRILFEKLDIRGVLTGLEQSYQEALVKHDYPPLIRRILGEMMAASVLLSANLKFEGRLILQAQGSGNVRLLMAECNDQQQLRSIARFEDGLPDDAGFVELLEQGQLVITIEPREGRRYQGVVPLEGEQLSDCLEAYFRYSEQLDSQIHLAADGQRAAGFLLQVLPASGSQAEDWQRIGYLGSTLKADELLQLDNETLLFRLFHEEHCRLAEPQPVSFRCDCSRQRTAESLRFMTEAELREILTEQGVIEVACQFCNTHYSFDDADITALFSDTGYAPGSDARH
ncbi:Hsp33 family molecular chaperone HslO [Marinobacterium arenosum]|uniref:Hsp33 family molecular chaperone HslO n=1 Tax=Marinobacterium arenosum TaxID=2862496 RepID=UPI001C94FCE4|nr:Hsp33 family molecular chaperone HslO [Marinobacterium arenosum]MBY4679077.1 Hsp33 family molecular chaperone HslO [Marinobacterium arenosum]